MPGIICLGRLPPGGYGRRHRLLHGRHRRGKILTDSGVLVF